MHKKKLIILLSSLILCGLGACATPSTQFDEFATRFQFEKSALTGRSFEHAIYKRGARSTENDVLHIYLGSDGTPWRHNKPARDPTQRNPLTLKLMLSDDSPAVYVGRPCYHGLNDQRGCSQELWTSARYSEEIIHSTVAAIEKVIASSKHKSIALIGYSGGGVIATLAAERIENVTVLVTIAANLDIDAWTNHHGYDRLLDSINPASQGPLRSDVEQYHFFGSDDRVVPTEVVNRYFDKNTKSRRRELSNFDHTCCWEDIWPSLLTEITQEIPSIPDTITD